jgi:hypothetical protein
MARGRGDVQSIGRSLRGETHRLEESPRQSDRCWRDIEKRYARETVGSACRGLRVASSCLITHQL